MLSVLPIFAIFIFVLLLFLASIKIIDLVFTAKNKFKANYVKKLFAAISLLLWFGLSAVITVFASSVVLKLPQTLFGSPQKAIADVAVEKEDCSQLKEVIYNAENKIYKLENHRYIEEVSPIFTIKLEYERGSKQLSSVAKQYLDLDINENSQHYSKQIAQKLQAKAQLFQDRTKVVENSQGVKQIANLLKQMDRVTEDRKNLVKAVKRQCNNSVN